MKDEKESLEAKPQLSDEQLDKVGGGLDSYIWYYGYCHDCGFVTDRALFTTVVALINEHKNNTGHTNVEIKYSQDQS